MAHKLHWELAGMDEDAPDAEALVSPPGEGVAAAGTSTGVAPEHAISAPERASPSILPASSPARPLLPRQVFLRSHPGWVRAWL